MYAIIATGGRQFIVSKGDKVKVEKIDAEVGSKVVLDKVLIVSGKETVVGTPYVEGATVEATVIGQGKAKKVIVYKYKPKKGYHKKNGHRQLFTQLQIDDVLLNGVALEDEAKEEPKAEEKPAKKAAKKPAKAKKPAEEVKEEVKEEVTEEVTETATEEAPAETTEEVVEEKVEEAAEEKAEEATEEA